MQYRVILLMSLLLLKGFFSNAQEGANWKIVLNKKAILTASGQEDTLKNKLQLKKSDLANNNIFKIEYNEPKNSTTKGWVRTIVIMDTTSAVVVQQDSVSLLQLYNKDLMKLLWSRQKVNVYTWVKPLDPGMAAAIRIRRFHLCSIELIE
jgi:hypothetical protein